MADKKPAAAKKASRGVWKLFEVKNNEIVRKNKSCPKCGQGFFMAQHSNRSTCGGCNYTEFGKK